MHITVTVKNVYGSDLVYPVDDNAAKFAALIKAKTFNAQQIAIIKSLGFAVHCTSGELPAEMRVTRF